MTDDLRSILQRLTALEALAQRPRPKPDIYQRVFHAEIDGSGTDGSKHTWHEVMDDGGTFSDFGDRECDDATHLSAAIEINGWKFVPAETLVVMIETRDTDGMRYEFVYSPLPPPLQDGTKDYLWGYSATDKAAKWVETGTTCPPPA